MSNWYGNERKRRDEIAERTEEFMEAMKQDTDEESNIELSVDVVKETLSE